MVVETTNELTEDEAELYDRQIRLWGLDSQKRLRCGRVLIIGMKGFGAEVVKNIVLSGVKSITLLDDGILSEDDICSQFLAPRECLGKSRVESSVARAQALNPMVQIIADSSRLQDKTDHYFNNFDVVVATERNLTDLQRINMACRMHNVKFFCGDVFGLFGYSFADLQNIHYIEEIVKIINVKFDNTSGDRKSMEQRKEVINQTDSFVPLADVLAIDWSLPENQRKMQKMDYSYFLMRVLMEFREIYNRDPEPKTRNSDIELLKNVRKKLLDKLSVPENKVPDSILSQVFAKISPACAVVAGVLSQEVVKVLSLKESPHNNFFFFNPEKCCGFVETLRCETNKT